MGREPGAVEDYMYFDGQPQSSQLRDEMDELHIEIGAAHLALLRRIAQFDHLGKWQADGARDMSEWVSGRFDISRWKALRWVRSAHALQHLPRIAEALKTGRLCLDKVVELTRFATPEDEAKLITWAKRVTVATIRCKGNEAKPESREDVESTDRARSLNWVWDMDGSALSLYGRFPVAEGTLITDALDRLAADIPNHPDQGSEGLWDNDTIDQRRADALMGLVLESGGAGGGPGAPTVVVHAGLDAILSEKKGAVFEDGPAIHPTTLSRLCCDARLQVVIENEGGVPIGVGHEMYSPPRWLRRQIEFKHNRTCTFPGCEMRRFLQTHHIVKWPTGPTAIDNLVLVCLFHHRLVHEYGWRVSLDPTGAAKWTRPDGDPFDPRPRARARGPT
jgi:hypothetical protein